MKTMTSIGILSFVAITLSMTTFSTAQELEETEEDRVQIESQINVMVTALRTGNSDLYASVYLPDADYINNNSALVLGSDGIREEIQELVDAVGELPNFALPIRNVRFLEDDVAVVDCFVTGTQSRATYFMVKRQNTWLISAARIIQPEG